MYTKIWEKSVETDLEDIGNSEYLVGRLRNSNNVAEGTNIPPQVLGEFRVPFVYGLRVLNVTQSFPGTQLTVAWYVPEGYSNINSFRIYAKNAYAANEEPIYVASSATSPCTFTLPGTVSGVATIFVQAVLNNGLASPVRRCTTTTVQTQDTVLTAGSIAAGSITTDKLNIVDVLVTGLTLTNNSPAAGRIAWSACTVYYQGVAYAITGSNTPNTTDLYVYWTVGNTTFTASASFTPATNIFLIATNSGGTADTAWNKVGRKHIQEDNLGVSLLKGFAIQPIATVTVDPTQATNTTFTALNQSTSGALLCIGMIATTASAFNATLSGSVLSIEIQVDGATIQSIPTLELDGAGEQRFATTIGPISSAGSGVGRNVGDYFSIYQGISFNTSCLVRAKITSQNTASGTYTLVAYWAQKVS